MRFILGVFGFLIGMIDTVVRINPGGKRKILVSTIIRRAHTPCYNQLWS